MSPLTKKVAFFLGVLVAIPAFGQAAQQNLLPQAVAGWTATSTQPFHPGAQLEPNAPTADPTQLADAAREYGFVSGETANYSHGSAAPITATVYRMKDPTGAYGEYSYLKTPDMNTADFSEHSATKSDEALVLLGNLVLKIDGVNPKRDVEGIKALISAVEPKAQDGLYPMLPQQMPAEDRVDRSDHYILGPVTLDQFFPGGIGNSLGFRYAPEVETAHFHVDGRDLTMLLADYPTPQIAQSQLDSLSQKFNINGSQPAATSPAFFAERSQTTIALVAGAQSSDEANKLLDQVRPASVLTWDQPTFQFKEPRFEVMVVGAFLGTGLICLFTIVGALAFSGFRLSVKKWFPNTIFDRNTQIDILQMGLVSKPIKAEDFYTFDGKRVDDRSVDKNLPDRTALRLFR